MASRGVDENIKTLQEDEIQVLEAVYEQDFEDLRKRDVWKVWRPAEFTILLYPSKEGVSADAQVYVNLRMRVKFTDSYPVRTPPDIEFQDEKGLSKADVLALEQRVGKLAASLVGQAMICDLCQFVQEYLHEKNHPPAYQSFYEGMLKNQRRREIVDETLRQRMEEEKRERERAEMEAIEIELRKRQEQRKQEIMQRRMNKSREMESGANKSSSEFTSTDGATSSVVDATGRNRSTSLPPPDDSMVTKRRSRLETIRDEKYTVPFKLFCGSKLQMNVKGVERTILIGTRLSSCHACHFDFAGVIEETGQSVVVSEWCAAWKRNKAGKVVAFSTTTDEIAGSFQKDLLALEQEYRGLLKLDHENLLNYLAVSIVDARQQQSPSTSDVFRLIYLKEHSFDDCVPLSQLLRRGVVLQRDYLRRLSKHVLSALEYLHSRAVLHKDLNEDCIWDRGGEQYLVSDYSVKRRIFDLLETYGDALFDLEGKVKSDSNTNIRLMVGMGKTSWKSEVFAFGVLLLKLIVGPSIIKHDEGGGVYGILRLLDDSSIFPSGDPIKDFIEKMINRDEDRRWNCTKLLSHRFITAEVDAGLMSEKGCRNVGRNSSDNEAEDEGEVEDDRDAALWTSSPLLGASARLETEFDILKLLGRGGFGDVMKVKNKLDDCVYAIKRVLLNPNSKELNKKIIREVKLLSRLNHENVVRYYNSWIEQRVLERGRSDTTSTTDTTQSSVVEVAGRKATVVAMPEKSPQPQRGSKKNTMTMMTARSEAKAKMARKGGLGYDEDEVEDLAPPPVPDESTEWSVSFRDENDDADSDSDSDNDEEDDDGDDVFGNLFYSKAETTTNLLDDNVNDDKEVENFVVFENGVVANSSTTASAEQKRAALLVPEEEEDSAQLVDNPHNWAAKGTTKRQESAAAAAEFVQILYIQMEFCQKNTLRQAIDYGEFVDDRKRAWRLFRELLEGLSYIHHQGMIHRDLKPVNIFLDSHDHVKIGDFGLATKLLATLSGQESAMAVLEDISQSGGGGCDWANLSSDIQADLTTKIGTALYVSPELCPAPKPTSSSTPTGSRIAYTQKVDMYSLGIVFFEMFYRPFKTAMERIMVLTDLRRPDIALPTDFVVGHSSSNDNRIQIVRLLLQHDADRRPTADELLLTDLLPPVEMQPSEFQLTVKQTLSNTQTHQYKWLINVLLDEQHPSTVQEYVYDADMYDRAQAQPLDALVRQWLEERLVDLFRLYGAVRIETPLLLPKSKLLTEHADARADLMDRSGCVLHLPYDLRVPFARYAVRNQLVHVKRFYVSKVYRDEKRSSHPCQLTECAFDIITNPSGCAAAAAEILALASDVVTELPALRDQNFVLKLNHTSILKAIMLHCGVEDLANYVPIMELLTADLGNRAAADRARCHEKLKSDFRLTEKHISQLVSLLQLEDSLTKVASVLRCITKRKECLASSLAKEGLHELETIKSNAETLSRRSHRSATGGLLPIVVSLKSVYNLHEYEGPVFQLVGEVKRSTSDEMKHQAAAAAKSTKKAGTTTTVRTFAAGGRYDQLLTYFRKPPRLIKPASAATGSGGGVGAATTGFVGGGNAASVQGAVGISFAFDLIVQIVSSAAIRQQRLASRSAAAASIIGSGDTMGAVGASGLLLPRKRIPTSPYDILVCSVGHKLMLKEKLALVRDLRLARFRADYVQDPVQHLEDLQDTCMRNGVRFVVIIKDGESSGGGGTVSPSARVRYWDKTQERPVDKRVILPEVVAFIQEKQQEESTLSGGDEERVGGGFSVATPGGNANQYDGSLGTSLLEAASMLTMAGNSLNYSSSGSTNNLSNLKVHYAVLERPPHHVRKRIEGQIANILSPVLQKFSAKETLELVATDLPGSAVKQLSAVAELNRDEAAFRASVADVVARFNKYKKEFRLVVDLICDLKFIPDSDDRQGQQQQQQISGGGGTGGGRGTVIILYSYAAEDCYRFLL